MRKMKSHIMILIWIVLI